MRDKSNERRLSRQQKKKRIRKKISGTGERPRLVIFRSLKHIYAQIVNDYDNKTLTGASSLSKSLQAEIAGKSKKEVATIVGKAVAEKAKSMKIETVVFDRGGYLYHGRVKALADGAREGGLKF